MAEQDYVCATVFFDHLYISFDNGIIALHDLQIFKTPLYSQSRNCW